LTRRDCMCNCPCVGSVGGVDALHAACIPLYKRTTGTKPCMCFVNGAVNILHTFVARTQRTGTMLSVIFEHQQFFV
jgi:hypothetical protein